ncbi:hypothetical protein HK405_012546 [Cladochytrium tenue]|nr:hypothetical protein HK405_012546 [Cladochytrium tenue]
MYKNVVFIPSDVKKAFDQPEEEIEEEGLAHSADGEDSEEPDYFPSNIIAVVDKPNEDALAPDFVDETPGSVLKNDEKTPNAEEDGFEDDENIDIDDLLKDDDDDHSRLNELRMLSSPRVGEREETSNSSGGLIRNNNTPSKSEIYTSSTLARGINAQDTVISKTAYEAEYLHKEAPNDDYSDDFGAGETESTPSQRTQAPKRNLVYNEAEEEEIEEDIVFSEDVLSLELDGGQASDDGEDVF